MDAFSCSFEGDEQLCPRINMATRLCKLLDDLLHFSIGIGMPEMFVIVVSGLLWNGGAEPEREPFLQIFSTPL